MAQNLGIGKPNWGEKQSETKDIMNDITLGSPTNCNGGPISVSVLLMALTPMTCGGGVSYYRIVTGSLSDHYLITH